MGGNVGDDDGTSRTPHISLPALHCVSLRYLALPCLALLCLSFNTLFRGIMHISQVGAAGRTPRAKHFVVTVGRAARNMLSMPAPHHWSGVVDHFV